MWYTAKDVITEVVHYSLSPISVQLKWLSLALSCNHHGIEKGVFFYESGSDVSYC